MAQRRGKAKTSQELANGRKLGKAQRTKSSQSKEEKLLKSKRSLSMFIDMPLDILGEIFQLLSPKDLVHLSNTCLMFRRTLSARSMAFIWRESREREDAPERPSDMSERDWAILLFSTQCMYCGSNRARTADFFIRQRLCKSCRNQELVAKSEVRNVDGAVFDLIPFTKVNGNDSLQDKHYYFGDIMDMQEKLSRLQEGAIQRKSGVKNKLRLELESFKTEQRKTLLGNAESVDTLIAWQTDRNVRLRQESDGVFEVRYKEVLRRFTDLGYNDDELADLGWEFEMHKLVRQKSRLTEKRWERIRETFQPIVDATRQYLIDLEVRKLRAGRRDIVEKLYARYKLMIPPHQLNHLPSVYNICRLGPFVSLVEADAGVTVGKADFQACLDALPQLIVDAYEGTKLRLRQSVKAANHPVHESLEFTEHFRELELATMVFRCNSCDKYVLGFDSGVKVHNCSPGMGLSWGGFDEDLPVHDDFPYPFEFSVEGASAAIQVLEAIGLDPKSATTSQLAEKDCAFRCLECIRRPRCGAQYAFSWLGMISHAIIAHGPLIRNKIFSGCDLLPLEYMPEYQSRIRQGDGCRWWSCTHCVWYMIGRHGGEYDDVIHHLRRHGIQDAEHGVDIVMMDQLRLSFVYVITA